MSRSKLGIVVLLFLLMINLVIAECPPDCPEETISLEDFSENPNFVDFSLMVPGDQRTFLTENVGTPEWDLYAQKYIGSLGSDDYSGDQGDDNSIIATQYFQGPLNSVDGAAYGEYMASKGVDIEVGGSLIGVEPEGNIEGKRGGKVQKVNVVDFKELYTFKVTSEGEIIIISKGKEHTFTGDVKVAKSPEISVSLEGESEESGEATTPSDILVFIPQGSVDGKEIKFGLLKFQEDKVFGDAECFGGICFDVDQTFTYIPAEKKMEVSGLASNMVSISENTDIIIKHIPDPEFLEFGNGIWSNDPKLDLIFNSEVTISNGEVTQVKGNTGQGYSEVGLNGARVVFGKEQTVEVHYGVPGKGDNQINFGDSFSAKGDGFRVVFDRREMEERATRKDITLGDFYANKFFIGELGKGKSSSDRYDRFGLVLDGGGIEVSPQDNFLKAQVTGNAGLFNGYWAMYNDEKGVRTGTYTQGLGEGIETTGVARGFDAVSMTVELDQPDGKREGYEFHDREGKMDLLKVPHAYQGTTRGGLPENGDEVKASVGFYLDLLSGTALQDGQEVSDVLPGEKMVGAPVDWGELHGKNNLAGDELICNDVPAAALFLATNGEVDMHQMLATGEQRRNHEMRDNLKAGKGKKYFKWVDFPDGTWGKHPFSEKPTDLIGNSLEEPNSRSLSPHPFLGTDQKLEAAGAQPGDFIYVEVGVKKEDSKTENYLEEHDHFTDHLVAMSGAAGSTTIVQASGECPAGAVGGTTTVCGGTLADDFLPGILRDSPNNGYYSWNPIGYFRPNYDSIAEELQNKGESDYVFNE
ncbi:hypothetical protein HOC13_00370 [Candidatus Woesearchaeota archaeon]|nr:hypothetical protein [Candidatus Woesearchaeota archaeon]